MLLKNENNAGKIVRVSGKIGTLSRKIVRLSGKFFFTLSNTHQGH